LQSYRVIVNLIAATSTTTGLRVEAELDMEEYPTKVKVWVANLRHELVELGAFDLQVLRRLDGSSDRAALQDVLEGLVARGELTIHQDGEPITERQRVGPLLRNQLEGRLAEFARIALLVG
jgi:methyltransferase-like protein